MVEALIMKTYRSTFLMVAVLVVLGALVYIVEFQGQNDSAGAPKETRVFSYNEQDVVAFELQSGQKRTALAKDDQGHWQLTAPEQAEADEWSFDTVLWQVAKLSADSKVADSADQPQTYGLDRPTMVVTFRTKDGHEETLTIGSANPRGTGNYAVTSDSPALYLINTAIVTDLQNLLTVPPKLQPTPTPGASPEAGPAGTAAP
ncbi:MAG: DUF4340 domain-containing protein [Chloroflexi bacterium]|nr:DUF4340 domain-containing protein [Chloroflexota bacterium]MCL5110068.1 DUF4340 domain-containing protein [Chloroflexota bacterium]